MHSSNILCVKVNIYTITYECVYACLCVCMWAVIYSMLNRKVKSFLLTLLVEYFQSSYASRFIEIYS